MKDDKTKKLPNFNLFGMRVRPFPPESTRLGDLIQELNELSLELETRMKSPKATNSERVAMAEMLENIESKYNALIQKVESETQRKMESALKPLPEQFIMLTDLMSHNLFSDEWLKLEAHIREQERNAATPEERERLAKTPLFLKVEGTENTITISRSWAHSKIPMSKRRGFYDTLVSFLKAGNYTFSAKQLFDLKNVRDNNSKITPAQLDEVMDILDLFSTRVQIEWTIKRKGRKTIRNGYTDSVFAAGLPYSGNEDGYKATIIIKVPKLEAQIKHSPKELEQVCSTLGYAQATGQLLRVNNTFRKQPNNEYSEQDTVDELIRQIDIIHYNTYGKGKWKGIPPRVTLEHFYNKAGLSDSNTYISQKGIWKGRKRLRDKLIAKLDELKAAGVILKYDIVTEGRRIYAFDIAVAPDLQGKLK